MYDQSYLKITDSLDNGTLHDIVPVKAGQTDVKAILRYVKVGQTGVKAILRYVSLKSLS